MKFKKMFALGLFLLPFSANAMDVNIPYSRVQTSIDKKIPIHMSLFATIEHVTVLPYKGELEIHMEGVSELSHKPFAMIAHSSLRYNPETYSFYIDKLTDISTSVNNGPIHEIKNLDKRELLTDILSKIPVYTLKDDLKQSVAKHLLNKISFTDQNIIADLELY